MNLLVTKLVVIALSLLVLLVITRREAESTRKLGRGMVIESERSEVLREFITVLI